MNNHHTNEEVALLDEFLISKPQKGKAHNAITWLSIFYMAVVLFVQTVNPYNFSLKRFDWQLTLGILGFPIGGLLFHLTSKKAGWILNSFYFGSISMAVTYIFFKRAYIDNTLDMSLYNWHSFVLLATALANTVLLYTTTIRKYFRISKLSFIIIILISLVITTLTVIT